MSEAFMQEAIRLASEAVQSGKGGPFGAVVVRDGSVIGRGGNQVTSTLDPTAHAEIVAIRDACANTGDFSLAGCEIYSSCEPCPMCLAAIHWARIDRIYYAATREDAALIGFDDAKIHHEMARPAAEREVGMKRLCAGEALAPFRAWQVKEDRTAY